METWSTELTSAFTRHCICTRSTTLSKIVGPMCNNYMKPSVYVGICL